MLTDIRILLVLGGVAGALVVGTAVVVSQRAEDRFRRERAEQEARWETDRAAYELQLSQAHQSVLNLPEPESAVSASAAVPGVEEQAERWLEQLQLQPEPAPDLGRVPLRRVVHAMESLVDLGPGVIPSVRGLLRRNEDGLLDPTWSMRLGTFPHHEEEPEFRVRTRLMMGMRGMDYPGPPRNWELAQLIRFEWPPTVRLGLLEVLKSVGGDAAEKALVEVLETTQRPAEVAFLAWALEESWPGKHREASIRVARDLLQHPPVPDPDDPQFAAGPALLYPVLHFFADRGFATNAVQLVVRSNGRVDTWAAEYVVRHLGLDGVVRLVRVYRDPRLVRVKDRMDLLERVLPWAGESPEVTELFLQELKEPPGDLEEGMRGRWQSYLIQRIAGTRGMSFPGQETPQPEFSHDKRLQVLALVREEALEPEALTHLKTVRELLIRPVTLPQGGLPGFRGIPDGEMAPGAVAP
jgi:hypothetical protein